MSLFYHCPHCFAAITQRRNLLDLFSSHPGFPFRNPDDCLSENSIGSPSPSPPRSAQTSPYKSINDDHDEAHDAAHILPLLPSTFASPQAYNYCNEGTNSDNTNDDLLDVEADPDYPLLAANLILQQDSDLMDDNEDLYGKSLDEFENDDMLLLGAIDGEQNA